jgi:uncharacterized protein YcbX
VGHTHTHILSVTLAALLFGAASQALDEGDDAAAWFSAFLGASVRLMRFASDAQRLTDPVYCAASTTRFSDGFPLLIISQASLDGAAAASDMHTACAPPHAVPRSPTVCIWVHVVTGLNAHLQAPLPMNRFRPNVVVGGARPFEEDEWASLAVGGADAAALQTTFASVKPCSRCKVTTIDQATGVDGMEPLRTLSSFRSGAALGWANAEPGGASWHAQVFFGWNLVLALPPAPGAVLAVGDVVHVLARRDWAAAAAAAA